MSDSSIWTRRARQDREVVGAPIDTFFAASSAADGLDLRALTRGDELLVHTCYSTYRFEVRDGAAGTVVASSDGKILTDPTPSQYLGASLSGRGSMLRLGWVLIGYKAVVRVPDGELLTSKVKALTLNGNPICTRVGGVH